MEHSQIDTLKLNSEERALIATRFNCSSDYVRKLISGTRKANSKKAKSILKAVELIANNKEILKRELNSEELDAE